MTQTYRMKLVILKKPYERPVHYKMDGQRFEAEKTIKFNVNSKQVTMFGIKIAMDELKQADIEGEAALYRGELTTNGLVKSVKGSRQSFPLHIQLKDSGEMVSHLQCKFYGEHEVQHACWGNPLSHLEFEVKVKDGGKTLEVVSEVFR